MKLTIDTKEFQKALKQYTIASKKALPDILNSKMFFIARSASRKTPITDRAKIEQELGVIAYKLSPRNRSGKVRKPTAKSAITKAGSLVSVIINKRLGSSGKRGLYGAAMKSAIASFLTKRFRSVGTLKAGWWDSIRTFGKASKHPSEKEVNTRVKGKSSSKIAADGFSPTAEMAYNVNSFDRQHAAYIDPRLNVALQEAFNEEAKSMVAYAANKLQRVANKYNAKP